MYVPRHFEDIDGLVADQVVSAYPFAILISTADRPVITHLPMLRIDDGTEYGLLIGHVAKPNPHVAQLDGTTPATAIFSGPHAYVSPNWYASPNLVPTWNYAAVHLHGVPRAINNDERTVEILDLLVAAFETPATGNWNTAQLSDGRMEGQIKGIVAFEMPITRIEAKVKMSQNRSAADVDGVATRLAASEHDVDRDTATLMREISARRETGS